VTAKNASRDLRQVAALALSSILVLAFMAYLEMFVPSALAPRVYVRWKADVSEAARGQSERELKLVAGEHSEGTTWAYDLTDDSPQAIRALVRHRFVEDTGNIDREHLTVVDDSRVGRTRIHGGLSVLRHSLVATWLNRLAYSFLFLCGLWFVTTGRRINELTASPTAGR